MYTAIANIYGPGQAAPGDQVTIEVEVQNLTDIGFWAALLLDTNLSPAPPISPDYEWLEAFSTVRFSFTFTMPNNDVNFTVFSFYWDGYQGVWVQDASRGPTAVYVQQAQASSFNDMAAVFSKKVAVTFG